MLQLIGKFVAAWRGRFGPKREASPSRERELRAAARRERQRRENRLSRA